MPDVVYNRQIIWAMVTAKIPIIQFFLKWASKAGASRDILELNTLKISARRFASAKTMDVGTTTTIAEEVKRIIEEEITNK